MSPLNKCKSQLVEQPRQVEELAAWDRLQVFDRIQNSILLFDKTSLPPSSGIDQHMYCFFIERKLYVMRSEIWSVCLKRCMFPKRVSLIAGSELTVFDTEYCKMAVAICYDLRFPELAQLAAAKGCQMLLYPGTSAIEMCVLPTFHFKQFIGLEPSIRTWNSQNKSATARIVCVLVYILLA